MKTLLCFLGTVLISGVIAFFALKPDSPEQGVKRDALKAIALVRDHPFAIRGQHLALADPKVAAETDALFDFVTRDVIAHLEVMLDDPDVDVAVDVARTLLFLDPNNPLPVEKLVGLLDTQPQDKIYVIQAIGRFGARARSAVPRLLPYLKHEDESILTFTAQTLACIGPDSHTAVPDLISLLNHKDDGVVVHVAQCLGRIGEDAHEAVPTLIDRYPSTSNRAKIQIIQALGRIRTQKKVIVRLFDRILANENASSAELTHTLYNLPQLMIDEDPVLDNVEKLSRHRDIDVVRAANWVLERVRPIQPKA